MEKRNSKVDLAQKYGVAEADIIPEFMPLLTAFDKVSEENGRILEKIKGSITSNHHHYEGTTPVAAFLLRWGWTTPLFIVTVLGMLWAFFSWHNPDRDKWKSLDRVVQYDEKTKGYYIDAKNFEIVVPKGKGQKMTGIRLILPDSTANANQAAL